MCCISSNILTRYIPNKGRGYPLPWNLQDFKAYIPFFSYSFSELVGWRRNTLIFYNVEVVDWSSCIYTDCWLGCTSRVRHSLTRASSYARAFTLQTAISFSCALDITDIVEEPYILWGYTATVVLKCVLKATCRFMLY